MTISKDLNREELPALKKILVVGNGGRENALAWALLRCKGIQTVFVAPGNGGTKSIPKCICLEIEENNVDGLVDACFSNQIDLVVIGPEAPLAKGVADGLRKAGLKVFGPSAKGAQLEASKSWAKDLMSEANIPTAKHWLVNKEKEALSILNTVQQPLVVKADGLAAGKGVTVPETVKETEKAIKEVFKGKFGDAGGQIVLEELLHGPEVSVFALCDGERFVLLPPAQDHKRLGEGDQGPNTGGMGAYAPALLLDEKDIEEIQQSILEPTVNALKRRGIDYRGVIYAGLMLTTSGPKVIEFNCRFGDPECQALMPLMGPELAQVLQACALGCLNKAPKLCVDKRCSACVVASAAGYPKTPRKGDQIDIELKEQDASIQLFHAGTTADKDGNLFTSGGRVLSVVAQGNNFDEAFNIAYKGLKQVHFKGIYYRSDIGNQVRKS